MLFTIVTGCGFTEDGTPLGEVEVASAKRAALHHLADLFGGGTVTQGEGVWRNDNGKTVIEPTLRFEVAVNCPDAEDVGLAIRIIRKFATDLRDNLQQESVILITNPEATRKFL